MARSSIYRHQVSDILNWNQIKANNETIFLLREIGPVGFLVQEEGSTKKHKVCLGDPHTCTCKDFRKEKDLCKHICWIFLKKFRLDKDDPISWQLGLVEREINELIFGFRNNPRKNKVESRKPLENGDGENESSTGIIQRKIEENDLCPVCQDDLMNIHKPVTYCRGSCGNNIHIRCMSVWTEHKKKELNLKMQDNVPCPICRGEFGSIHLLMQEMQNSRDISVSRHLGKAGRQQRRVMDKEPVRHHGFVCCKCNCDPISGKLYKCVTCTQYYLCCQCFADSSVHSEHLFLFREYCNGRWNPAPSTRSIPENMVNSLQTNEIDKFDYNLLQQLDKPVEASSVNLKTHQVNSLPNWTITTNSRLVTEPGHQCRLCLMAYKPRDCVRKLPQCQHVFHTTCIDPWLIHKVSACPIDDVPVIRIKSSTTASTAPTISGHNQLLSRTNQSESLQNTLRRMSLNGQTSQLTSALCISSITNQNRPISNNINSAETFPANIARKFHQLPPLSRNPFPQNPSRNSTKSRALTTLSIKSMKLSNNIR